MLRSTPLMRLLALLLLAGLVLAAPGLSPKAPAARSLEAPSKLQPRAPQASKRMGMRKRNKKRADPLKKKDYSAFLCPGGAAACPVLVGKPDDVTPESASALENSLEALADWFRVGFECIELDTELNQCGGCLALGKGQDCSTISNARVTGCEKGVCTVMSCKDGYVVSSDRSECIRPREAEQAILA